MAITMTQLCTDDLDSPEIKESITQMHAGELQESLRYYEGFFKEKLVGPHRKFEVYMSLIRSRLTEALLTKNSHAKLPEIDENEYMIRDIRELLEKTPDTDKHEKIRLQTLLTLCQNFQAPVKEENTQEKSLSDAQSAETVSEDIELPQLSAQTIRYLFGQALQPIHNSIEVHKAALPKNNMHAFFIKNRQALARFDANSVIQKTKKFLEHYPFAYIFATNHELAKTLERTRYQYHTEGSNKCEKADLLQKLSWIESDILFRKDAISLDEFQFLIVFFQSIEYDLIHTLERGTRRRLMK